MTRHPEILQELEVEIHGDCDWLTSFLFALKVRTDVKNIRGICEIFTHDGQVIDEISPRSRDTIIGLGEKLACKMMTAILRDRVRVRFSSYHISG